MPFDSSPEYSVVVNSKPLSINQVLRKTYFLLSATLVFSVFTAFITMLGLLPPAGPALTLIGMFGLMILTQSLAVKKNKWALFSVFAFTGFMGYILAPLLGYYLANYTNGAGLVMAALGGTAAIFLSLSLYTLTVRKDFSYLGGFLFVAITVAFLASIANLFLEIPLFSVLVSCSFILISSGLIIFHTSRIIEGGERDYIMATIALYVSLFNIFVSLLNVLGFLGGNRK
jgi:Integral membrane protein, interacts with FtsH